MVVNIPEKYYNLIKDICLKFLWNDKPHLISYKYKVIINKCQKGELNFPEIFQKMYTFRMTFLSRMLDESYKALCKSTCLYLFSKVEDMKLEIELLFCKIPMTNLTCLPEFYQIMLKAWYTLQENINIDVDKDNVFHIPLFFNPKIESKGKFYILKNLFQQE